MKYAGWGEEALPARDACQGPDGLRKMRARMPEQPDSSSALRRAWARLFEVKPLAQLLSETERPGLQLKRTLGPVQLTALGIGAIVGAGIFSTVGTAAAGGANHLGAGPALSLSFLIVAVACCFSALCYAEFASLAPVSGSAYTYAYASLGELVAWIIGWDLILEYAIGNVAVAISWSAYFQELLRGFGFLWPEWLGTDYRTASEASALVAQAHAAGQDIGALGESVLHEARAFTLAPRPLGLPIIFNLPAVLAVAAITWILVRGIRESARFNTSMVVLKLGVIVFFLAVGAFYVKPDNWTPFAPHGTEGVLVAAAIIFFAYIGFDAVSTAAEEARNPQRDLPIGIIASLVACTVVYVVVAIVLTGLAPYKTLGTADPLASAFSSVGLSPRALSWVAGVISAGALCANTSVLIAFQLGQPRIFFAMARDGLLPRWAARVHPRFRTPHVTTIITGVFVAFFAGITNIKEMVELTNIGTLFAFILVAVGILVLRRKDPDRTRPFRTPWVPWVPLAAIACCAVLMAMLPGITWGRFGLWMVAGLALYFIYGFRQSRLRRLQVGGAQAAQRRGPI
ncbi:MAG: putative amino acid permease YhdG [Verrucomicrobia bacterium ADurb.Bin006]|jgi:APA family basic amino acid/polyamine antiporter|nr:MAG: putative amino acid permease YhdG [Verrucomicrobia bacterium ADurb.Bin006]